MTRTICTLVLASLMTLSQIEKTQAAQILYAAIQSEKKIAGYEVNPASGKLELKFSTTLPGVPGPLAFSPDRRFVYAAMTGFQDNKAGVATLERQADGSLTMRGTCTIVSRAPYIRCSDDGRFLLAAHYGAGEVTVYLVVNGICTAKLLDQQQTARTAHCIELDPSGRFAFVPHTAPNRVYQFRLQRDTGKLVANQPAWVDGPDEDHSYHQPRHLAFHPRLPLAFTSNERGGGISSWAFDAEKGTLSLNQTLSTLPEDYEGESAAADIHMTPNGKFIYVSNRDLTQRPAGAEMRDTLAAFRTDPQSGHLTALGQVRTAPFPRSFCIDLQGKFLYAAGQRSKLLYAYRINQDTGQLVEFARYDIGENPIWVMCGRTKSD